MRGIAFFITWTCYGQWLHGDGRGSVDVDHNVYGEPWLTADAGRCRGERERMDQSPYSLDPPRRRVVLQAIRDVCAHRGWTLYAVHVRSSHVHVVGSGAQTPERMMNDFKAYASRALNAANLGPPERKRWARHGSTRHIDDEKQLAAAVDYVLNKQGEPMARWPEASAGEPRPSGSGGREERSRDHQGARWMSRDRQGAGGARSRDRQGARWMSRDHQGARGARSRDRQGAEASDPSSAPIFKDLVLPSRLDGSEVATPLTQIATSDKTCNNRGVLATSSPSISRTSTCDPSANWHPCNLTRYSLQPEVGRPCNPTGFVPFCRHATRRRATQ